ncbi:MAG: transcription termination/antitermination protein NusG [Planctomycetota bacterium]|nr:transcription termination/antitermination protein NusG [Planctomycetota bacterium]
MSEQEQPSEESATAAESADDALVSEANVAANGAEDPGPSTPAESSLVAEASEADQVESSEGDHEEEAAQEESGADASPVLVSEAEPEEPESAMQWYILKVQVNRESSICDALLRRIKMEGLEQYFGEVLVPTEDVREFTKSGKQRIVKRKLYPGYIVVNMIINDDTWFLVRETPGIGDFTGAVGKPAALNDAEIGRIKQMAKIGEETSKEETAGIKTAIKFRPGDRVRVKEGYFQNFEGDVETIDESNGRVTVMISIFGRATPVELDHWQVEDV